MYEYNQMQKEEITSQELPGRAQLWDTREFRWAADVLLRNVHARDSSAPDAPAARMEDLGSILKTVTSKQAKGIYWGESSKLSQNS